jgi:hypothetical protein
MSPTTAANAFVGTALYWSCFWAMYHFEQEEHRDHVLPPFLGALLLDGALYFVGILGGCVTSA